MHWRISSIVMQLFQFFAHGLSRSITKQLYPLIHAVLLCQNNPNYVHHYRIGSQMFSLFDLWRWHCQCGQCCAGNPRGAVNSLQILVSSFARFKTFGLICSTPSCTSYALLSKSTTMGHPGCLRYFPRLLAACLHRHHCDPLHRNQAHLHCSHSRPPVHCPPQGQWFAAVQAELDFLQ